ncbi:intradiol ring-cleavage dioxygenase [Streptomyces sclerotialus]|uniref:intradiol ring-cleavage dioxygenase n=1 Tax=Streptomyces sclerotialus TaxID=1957 RepID=UPI0004C90FED
MTEESTPRLSRRRLLAAGGAGIAVAGLGGAALSGSASAEEPATTDCLRLTKESIEGPYYLDYDKYRSDVTEGKPGVPLTLRIRVIDSVHCRPLSRVAVDIWHCDALGVYSSYEEQSSGGGGTPTPPTGTPTAVPTGPPPGGGGGHAEPDSDTTYLRGFQMTDRAGWVTFRTVFPGWYRGRAVHIHTKVHVDGTFTHGKYEGGTDCHTGQLYFPEPAIQAVARLDPYATNTTERTTNAEDMLYTGDTAADGMLALRYDERRVGRGVHAAITLGVDPDAVNDGRDGFPAPTSTPAA